MKSTVSDGMDTGALKARLKPRRATAVSQHSRAGWSQAPRPGNVPWGSGVTLPSTVAKRCSALRGALIPHPAQRRLGGVRPLGLPDDVGILVGERLVGVQAAVARPRQGGV